MHSSLWTPQPVTLVSGGHSAAGVLVEVNHGISLVVALEGDAAATALVGSSMHLRLRHGESMDCRVIGDRAGQRGRVLHLGWPGSGTAEERRRYVRVEVLIRADAHVPGEAGDRVLIGVTRDLSAGGMRLILAEPLPVGAQLDFRLHLLNRGVWHCRGMVVRAGTEEKEGGGSTAWIGVEFLDLSADARRAIDHLLFSIPRA